MLHNPRKIIFNFLLPEMNFICRQNSENFWWFLVPCHFLYYFCIEMLRCMFGVLCAVHHVLSIVYSWEIVYLARNISTYILVLCTLKMVLQKYMLYTHCTTCTIEKKKMDSTHRGGMRNHEKKSLILNLCIMTIIIILYYKSQM